MTPEDIRAERDERGLTQAAAAAQLGVARNTWARWEAPADSMMARRPTGLYATMLQGWMAGGA